MSPGGLSAPTNFAEGTLDPEAEDEISSQEKPIADDHTTGDNIGDDNTVVPTAATSSASLEKPVMVNALIGRIPLKGEPESGFGAPPTTRREVLKTTANIIVPATLMTFEQDVGTAQAFYVADGGAVPWVSSLDLHVKGVMLIFTIVYDQGGVLCLHFWAGDSSGAYVWTSGSAQAV
jgi:hypothetical protein